MASTSMTPSEFTVVQVWSHQSFISLATLLVLIESPFMTVLGPSGQAMKRTLSLLVMSRANEIVMSIF